MQSVYSGLRNIGPLLLNCYPKLTDIIRNWNTSQDASIKSVPNVFYGRHIGRIRGPIQYLNILSCEELHAQPSDMGTGVIMLERNVVLLDKRHYNRSKDLIAVPLGVQVAVDEMQWSSLSVCNSCPHHDTPSTMSDSSCDICVSKPFTSTAPHTMSPIRVIHVES